MRTVRAAQLNDPVQLLAQMSHGHALAVVLVYPQDTVGSDPLRANVAPLFQNLPINEGVRFIQFFNALVNLHDKATISFVGNLPNLGWGEWHRTSQQDDHLTNEKFIKTHTMRNFVVHVKTTIPMLSIEF